MKQTAGIGSESKYEDKSVGAAEVKLIQIEQYGGEATLSQLCDSFNQAIHSLASRLEVVERATIERSEADTNKRIQKLDDTVVVLAKTLEAARKRWIDDSRRLWDAVDSHTHELNEIEDGEEMQTLPAAVFRGRRPSDDAAELDQSQDLAQVSDRCDGEKVEDMSLLQKKLFSSSISKQAESAPESSSLPSAMPTPMPADGLHRTTNSASSPQIAIPEWASNALGSPRVNLSPMLNVGKKSSPTSKSAQLPGLAADAPPRILIGGNTAVRMMISPTKVQRSLSPAHPRSMSPTQNPRSMSPTQNPRSMSPMQKASGLGTPMILSGWSSPFGSPKLPGPTFSMKFPGFGGSMKLPGPHQAHLAAAPAQQPVSYMCRSTTPGRRHVGPQPTPLITPRPLPRATPRATPQASPQASPRGTPQASPRASPQPHRSSQRKSI